MAWTYLPLSALLTLLPLPPAAPAATGPTCDPGPRVYVVECSGPVIMVQLDATGSTGTGRLAYEWSGCPNATFDDPSSPTPIVLIEMEGRCAVECGGIRLTVTDSVGSSTCNTAVFVQDTTAPDLSCPDDLTVAAGLSTDPSNTGTASATDSCNPNPTITYSDVVTPDTDPSTPLVETITRTWAATDGCSTATCVQTIRVEEKAPPMEGHPDLDIKPGSCPNPVNVRSNGVLPVALVGAADFDVSAVDVESLVLRRTDGVGGEVSPIHWRYEDVATAFEGEDCDCHTLKGDGTTDLSLKFANQQVVQMLALDGVPNHSFVELELTGTLGDGGTFAVRDCIRVKN